MDPGTAVVSPPIPAPAPPIDTDAVTSKAAAAGAAAALDAKAKADATAARDAAKAAADSAAAEALRAAQTAADDARAQLATAQKAARRQAALASLPGLKNAEQFLPLVLDKVSFTDDGALTPESVEALGAWREANPFLFDAAPPPPGTTPVGGGSHRPADGEFDAADAQALRYAGVAPRGSKDHWSQRPVAKSALVELAFGGLLR